MSSAAAFSFLTLPDDLVKFSGWEVGDSGQAPASVGDILENWDYARDLEVAARVSLSWPSVASYLQVPANELSLRLVLVVGTGTGRLPRRLERLQEAVLSEGNAEVRLRGIVSGARLSGQLRLALVLVLDRAPGAPGKLSPKLPGARLWQSNQDILIEDGGSSRFPTEAVSFSKGFKGTPIATAPWYLHWEPTGLSGDFAEQVRLYVNTDREEVFGRFKSGDGPTLQAILADVISQMVSGVLDLADGQDLLGQCEDGSVGDQIQLWMSTAFPGDEFASIKALKDRFPGKFRAAILGMAELQGAS